MAITLVIVEDHKMVLDGLRLTLSQFDDLNVVRVFSGAKEALDFLQMNRVDLVLSDIRMLPMNGIEFIEALKKANSNQKCLALTSIDNFRQMDDCKAAGFSGYVMKSASIEELYTVIKKVVSGYTHFQERIFSPSNQSTEQRPFKRLFHTLTPSEKKICLLLLDGFSVHEIALKEFKSIETIRTQKKSIHQKLSVSTTQELMKIARDEFSQLT